jgi:Secretion system C-terminal sorting domain/Beta-propeller repeat
MKNLLLLLLATLTLTATQAQDYRWAHGFGGPNYDSQGSSIATDAQANVYVTGFFGDSIDFDSGPGTAIVGVPAFTQGMFVAKYDSAGNYQWAFSINNYSNYGTPHLAVNATGLYITSCFAGTVDFDPSAATATLTANNADIVLAKYDLNGNYVWAKNMGGNSSDAANGIAIDNVGNSYITGYFKDTADFDSGAGVATLISDTLQDIFFAKYDLNGNYLWAYDLCDFNGTFGTGQLIELDNLSNEIYITGAFHGTIDFDRGAGIFNITDNNQGKRYIAKYSSSGNFIWAGTISGAMSIGISDIYISNNAGNSDIYICGSFWGIADFDLGNGVFNVVPNSNYNDIYFAKYTSTGNLIWIRNMGDANGLEGGNNILTDNNDNIYLAGFYSGTTDFDPGSGIANLAGNGSGFLGDIFFAKYDSSGNYIWARGIGGLYNDTPQSIALDPTGSIYLTGYFTNSMDADPGPGNATLSPAIGENIFIGKYSNTPTGIINSVKNLPQLCVYPKPADDFISVNTLPATIINGQFTIIDINGRVVNSGNLATSSKINVAELLPGVYFLTIKSKDFSASKIFQKC